MSGPVKTAGQVAAPQAGDELAAPDLGQDERGDLVLRPARRDEAGDEVVDLFGRPDGLLIQPISAADLRSRSAETIFSAETSRSAIPISARNAVEGQVHAVGQAVADLARFGVVDGDRPGIELLEVVQERFLDAGDVSDDLVVGPGLLDALLIVQADDGPRPAVRRRR